MDINTFCQSYIEFAFQVLAVSQKPAVMEREYKRLKLESRHYVDYLEKFETFFDIYPALKNELFAYLAEHKTGAFIEYRLDLFYAELTKTESLKTEIRKEINGLRNDFADETKEWLPEEEYAIEGCFRHLDTANIQQIIGFLNNRLTALKTKKEFYLSEIQRLQYAAKTGERQAEDERRRLSLEEARRRGIELTEQEIQERRRKAQEELDKQQTRRRKNKQ
ncbi:MAG: hypothetical protein LBB79_01050 [Prevotellaceae bacterium]|jgi:hypothetical protein|nr:hypothetical protein [Prevotellaceae bacterium]